MAIAATFQSVIPSIIPFRAPRSIQALLGRWLGIDEIERVYGVLKGMDAGRTMAERLLDFLAVTYDISEADLDRIPRSGPAIVTMNHPFGILEGAVLASLLGQIRRDVRVLANGILTNVPELRETIIAVDPIAGSRAVARNGYGLRRSLEHLAGGGLLVVFPAGEVSHYQWKRKAIADPEWHPVVARLVGIAARKGCGVPVVPAFVEGANSPMFHLAGLAHARFRTALLVRELLNKRGRQVEIRVGAPIPADKLLAMPSAREQTDYLRWRTYLLASREPFKPLTSSPLRRERASPMEPAAAAVCGEVMAAEITALPAGSLLDRSGDLEVYIAEASRIPQTLHELGRLREITFRAAGEGTGKALDLDEFDDHYLHLFVWQARKQEVVGAYRLAGTDAARKRAGVRGLYTLSSTLGS